jgi:hypothetical protein
VRRRFAAAFAFVSLVGGGCGAFVGQDSSSNGGGGSMEAGTSADGSDADGATSGATIDASADAPSNAIDAATDGDAKASMGDAGTDASLGFCASQKKPSLFCSDFDESGIVNADFPSSFLSDGTAFVSLDAAHHASAPRSALFSFLAADGGAASVYLETSSLNLASMSAFTLNAKVYLTALPADADSFTLAKIVTPTNGEYDVTLGAGGVTCTSFVNAGNLPGWIDLQYSVGSGTITCAFGASVTVSGDVRKTPFTSITVAVGGDATATQSFAFDVDDVVVTSP